MTLAGLWLVLAAEQGPQLTPLGEFFRVSVLPWALAFIAVGGAAVVVMAVQEWRRDQLVLLAIRDLELPPSASLVKQELERLVARDPGFVLSAFEAKVRSLFERVMAARQRGEPPAREEVSDGVYRRAVVEHALERERGLRLFHGGPRVGDVAVIGAFSDPHFDALHVRVAYSARSAMVPARATLAEAEALAARAPEKVRAEVWVFVRRPDARSLAGQSPGKCPSCGAPYQGGAANFCSHCQAILNSGAYDWVLAQELDWDVYRGPWRDFTGLREMLAHDEAFSPEAIEDHAALIFWKWLHARADGKPELLGRLATPEFQQQLAAEAEALAAQDKKRWTYDVRVAGVDLLLMELDADDHQDEVAVRVRWTGSVGETSAARPPTLNPSSFATVLTLTRQSGVKTDVRTGVSTDRCHHCRAAQQAPDAVRCAHCDAELEPGAHEFVLAQALSFEGFIAARAERAALTQFVEPFLPSFKYVDERLRLLRMMASLAVADGDVSSAERTLLKTCARRWGIPFSQVRPVLEGAPPGDEVRIERGGIAARAFLNGLCDAAAIDGVIDRRERALIVKVARHLGVDAPTQPALEARAEAARRALRASGADAF